MRTSALRRRLRCRRRQRPEGSGDAGQVTAYTAALAAALVFVAGLAWDGSQLLKTYVEASDLAESAARAGAHATQPEDLLAGQSHVDPTAAQAAVSRYLASAGHAGASNVTVSGEQVTVSVTLTQSAQILPLGSRAISATATATPTRGVEAGERGA